LDGFAEGSVALDGEDIRHDTDTLRNRYVGYVFQNYNLHRSRTCFENVADALRLCGLRDEAEIERRVMSALSGVGMEKYAKRTPDTLSGGQQQRIAIARAIVKAPRIVLADEPTGNLDELNTVMIMDLLKSIAKNHLVLLVTHEASLVDHYCDTVIALSDGRITDIKNNENADGYTAKNKNHVYLGELERQSFSLPCAEIEYYGGLPEEPIRLRIVRHGGKLYADFGASPVQVLDAAAEVKLKEGVFKPAAPEHREAALDVTEALPPVRAEETGRLFSFGASLLSGYRSNFKSGRRGKKLLRACMCLFAAVIVFTAAIYGTFIRTLLDARRAYSPNTFYVYTPDGEVSDALLLAMENGEAAIDFIRLESYYPSNGDTVFHFRIQAFETFSPSYYMDGFHTNAVLLDRALAQGLTLCAGKSDCLRSEEILITTAVADALLEGSVYGHISEYAHLIGVTSSQFSVFGKNLRVAGIVESEEAAVYCDPMALARYVQSLGGYSAVKPASDFGLSVSDGEAVLALKYGEAEYMPERGASIPIQGKDFAVSSVLRGDYTDYEAWLAGNGVEKLSPELYFKRMAKEKYPSLDENDPVLEEQARALCDLHYAEYYEYYYDGLEAFMKDLYFFRPDEFALWLYFEKGEKDLRYAYTAPEYYTIRQYEARYGRPPTREELSGMELAFFNAEDYYELYGDEYYASDLGRFDSVCYLVSDADYLALSKRMGETYPGAEGYSKAFAYTVVHSSEPAVTEAWLTERFGALQTEEDYLLAILTPDTIFENLTFGETESTVGGFVALGVILAVMCVCMYFIMRASLMSRIKEIGIYRAIGVSKKNLVFKFFTEALVLTTLTVFLGYLAMSGFILVCKSLSPMVSVVFYYPLPMALAVLLLLYAVSLLCGTLPILSLLRKTPSEILSKYDV
ncbi:MAG: ATP-binding cassette domain-containing protein, partial [Clostridia bacterium]|nr:ATP-binding cassette domain-containing protein [Clostridia bacterium]